MAAEVRLGDATITKLPQWAEQMNHTASGCRPDSELVSSIDRGVYIAVFFLRSNRHITIGRLGRLFFERGLYFYVGSAQRNLQARLARHGRRRKARRWHIDYLAANSVMIGALVVLRGKQLECQMARSLSEEYVCPHKGFGSSDCRCRSHLFYKRL